MLLLFLVFVSVGEVRCRRRFALLFSPSSSLAFIQLQGSRFFGLRESTRRSRNALPSLSRSPLPTSSLNHQVGVGERKGEKDDGARRTVMLEALVGNEKVIAFCRCDTARISKLSAFFR